MSIFYVGSWKIQTRNYLVCRSNFHGTYILILHQKEENKCQICHFCHMCVTKVKNNNGNKFRGKTAKLPISFDAIAIDISD